MTLNITSPFFKHAELWMHSPQLNNTPLSPASYHCHLILNTNVKPVDLFSQKQHCVTPEDKRQTVGTILLVVLFAILLMSLCNLQDRICGLCSHAWQTVAFLCYIKKIAIVQYFDLHTSTEKSCTFSFQVPRRSSGFTNTFLPAYFVTAKAPESMLNKFKVWQTSDPSVLETELKHGTG